MYTMKNILSIIFLAVMAWACSGNGSPFGYELDDPVGPVKPTPTLSLSGSELTFAAAGETQYISLYSNVTWKLDNKPSWLTVSPEEGSGNTSITLIAESNTSTTQRSGTVRFSTTDGSYLTVQLDVTQQPKEDTPGPEPPTPTLFVSESPLSFTAAADNATIGIDGNDEWTATVTHLNGSGWCSLSSQSGTAPSTLTVTVSANDNTTERNAKVTITGTKTGKTVTVNVSQAGKTVTPVEPSISVDHSELTFEAKPEGTQHVTVTVPSTLTWDYSVDQSWCHVVSKTSTGFNVRLDENTAISRRTAIITLYCGDKKCTVTVTQKAAKIGRNEYEEE